MPKVIEISIPVTGVGEATATSVLLRESVTLTSPQIDVVGGTQALGAYSGVARTLTWNAPVDGTKYVWVYLLSVDLQESDPYVLLPTTAANLVNVVINTETVFGTAIAGAAVAVTPIGRHNSSGVKSLVREASETTDANGLVVLTLYADSGAYNIVIDDAVSKRIDTYGLGGTSVAFTEL